MTILSGTSFFGSAGSLLMSCSLPVSGRACSPGKGPFQVTLTLNTADDSGLSSAAANGPANTRTRNNLKPGFLLWTRKMRS